MAVRYENASYGFYGALGGLLGTYVTEWYQAKDTRKLLGKYEVESAIAGLVGNYTFMYFGNPDSGSGWKGMLVGWASAAIFNNFLRGIYDTTMAEMM